MVFTREENSGEGSWFLLMYFVHFTMPLEAFIADRRNQRLVSESNATHTEGRRHYTVIPALSAGFGILEYD